MSRFLAPSSPPVDARPQTSNYYRFTTVERFEAGAAAVQLEKWERGKVQLCNPAKAAIAGGLFAVKNREPAATRAGEHSVTPGSPLGQFSVHLPRAAAAQP